MAERSGGDAPGETATFQNATIWVTIRYFAAARAAAGVTEERIQVPVSVRGRDASDSPNIGHGVIHGHSTVGDLLDAAAERHGTGLARVLTRCSFLLDEVAVHGRQTPVQDGQAIDILPPFAGG